MPESIYSGRCASSGITEGIIRTLQGPLLTIRRHGSPAAEASALRNALELAGAALAELVADGDEESAAIIDFQLAFVEDETLSAPAYAAIEGGASAGAAWMSALDSEITYYQNGADEYFRARATDLIDLRDRVLLTLSGDAVVGADIPAGSIVVADDLAPSVFLAIDWSKGGGIVLRQGSATSHVAILARSRGVPMLVGVAAISLDAISQDDCFALLDASMETLIVNPEVQSRGAFALRYREELAAQADAAAAVQGDCFSKDGQRVEVWLNVADPDELSGISPENCDGIGLVRSEFFFQRHGLTDEAAQYDFYVRLLDWAAGRPVVVRTLDAGADKPIQGLTLVDEQNPFLGVRGVRLSLLREDVFIVQLRALARAAVRGMLWVMLPMVSVPRELEQVRAIFQRTIAELQAEGVEARMPALGMMVEVPAAALTVEHFSADFYSIGSNDLVQYVMAAGRDSPHLGGLQDVSAPAVLGLIRRVVEAGNEQGKSVSLCGDAAADVAVLPLLLATGLRKISVAPAALGRVKAAVALLELVRPEHGHGKGEK